MRALSGGNSAATSRMLSQPACLRVHRSPLFTKASSIGDLGRLREAAATTLQSDVAANAKHVSGILTVPAMVAKVGT